MSTVYVQMVLALSGVSAFVLPGSSLQSLAAQEKDNAVREATPAARIVMPQTCRS